MNSKAWTNQEVIDTFMDAVVSDINNIPDEVVDGFVEMGKRNDRDRIREAIGSLSEGLIHNFLSFLAQAGPSDWPGIRLVNGATLADLSDDLQWDFSEARARFGSD